MPPSIQCSKLKPSYEFHFEGLWNFCPSVEGLVQIQDVNPRIYKWYTKLILNLFMNYVVHVFSTMWRIKNQACNPTSCSDNALQFLVLVADRLYWGLQVTTSSFSIWSCVPKGYWREVYFEGHYRVWRALKTAILNIVVVWWLVAALYKVYGTLWQQASKVKLLLLLSAECWIMLLILILVAQSVPNGPRPSLTFDQLLETHNIQLISKAYVA